ncbi:arginyl-tRNA synthetase [Sulfuriferula multivorans]|uniref:Arginine--tRNA ligase n=1 Tax=Sulfuriferula multivorans TaxID=1559896 RepID=A0A401JG86_9PROT|nr:arginine--tRNA ligase [Sulfuriferula multivorans]GBL46651.1 arginyl-tRNA synthetase [Sulfuriferula multivorans]
MSAPYTEIKPHLVDLFRAAIAAALPEAADAPVEIDHPRDAAHGDYACSVAMKLAKTLRRNPRELALIIQAALPASPLVDKTEIAGAGFINVFLRPAAYQQIVPYIFARGDRFGDGRSGQGKRVQVEFVSANPTGPLHVGHGRGAAYGASLANVLAAAGYEVAREYYVNDAGRQMDILALSTWLRYLELCGIHVPFPGNAYQGDYVRGMAQMIFNAHADRYVHEPWRVLDGAPDFDTAPDAHLDQLIANAKTLLGADYAYVHDLVLTEQLGDCRNDLLEFGVEFDQWFSEQSLYDSGIVQRTLALLEKNGHIYTQDGAKWFRSTHFGDEKDRVVLRENGQYTYFASDIAYHLNKLERGFDWLIDVWGADHHGYIARVTGALQALGLAADKLSVALVQFAVLYRDGQKAAMSTRSGEFVTLRELRREVGNDAARFFYVLRKSDQHLDFDLDLAKSQTSDNPVYYIQYAHARICSVLAQWGGDPALLADIDFTPLTNSYEIDLLHRLAEYPGVVDMAARELAPHAIAYALKDIAGALHAYYNAEQFLVDDKTMRHARLALITATRHALRHGLALLGVNCPDKM